MTKILSIVSGVLLILLVASGWTLNKLYDQTLELKADIALKDTRIKGLQDERDAYMVQQGFAECNTSQVNELLKQCYDRLAEQMTDLSQITEDQLKLGGEGDETPPDAFSLDFLYKQYESVR